MKCDRGRLRAFVDNELSRTEREVVQQHLSACSGCTQKAAEMMHDSQQVQTWMAGLAFQDEGAVDPKVAYVRYQTAVRDRPERSSGLPAWLRLPQIGVAGSAVALIVLLSFSPAQTWAQRFLKMLRVQKLAVVTVDTTALMHAGLPDGRSRALSQLISDSVVVTMKPGNPTVVSDVAAATASTGFKVETLDSLGAPQRIAVEDEGAFHMTLDVDRIRAVLEEAGRSDIQVPDSVNGSVLAVHVSKGVSMAYGNCADAKNGDGTCIRFLQIPSPSVSVPQNLNMQALAEAGLQLTGLTATAARTVAETIDWSSTLVVPVPQDKASYRTVPVNGVNGTLIEWTPSGPFRGSYDLIWIKSGIVHSVSGQGSSDKALAAVAGLSS